jgi:hypothetical protein
MVMAMKPVTGKLRKGGGKGLSGDALVGKVSQSTINSIKKMGMTEALKLAGKNGATAGGAAREFQEGVRRMYGAKRLATAKATYAPKPKLGAKTVMAPKGGVKPAAKPAAKPMTKSKSNSNFGKVVGGLYGAAAVGALVASKGKATGLASKMAPGLAKSVSKSAVGRAVFGSGKPLTSKAFAAAKAAPKPNAAKVTVGPKGSFGPTTKSMAKSKLGTPSEYASKAGQASARASIKPSGADAARAAASKVTKKKAAGASLASNKKNK